MAKFRLRKAAGGSTLRGGDGLRQGALPTISVVPRGALPQPLPQVLAH